MTSVRADYLTVLWLASADNRVSASHTVSRLELQFTTVYSAATFPATVWSQFKLDLKERDNKRSKTRAGANSCSKVASQESHDTANVSLLAHQQKSPTVLLMLNIKNLLLQEMINTDQGQDEKSGPMYNIHINETCDSTAMALWQDVNAVINKTANSNCDKWQPATSLLKFKLPKCLALLLMVKIKLP